MKRLGAIVGMFALGLAAARARADEEYFKVLGHEIAQHAAAQAKIDAARAIEIGQRAAGDAAFTMVELIMDGPRPIYEVLYVTPKGPDEVELDAVTGEVISFPPSPPTDQQQADGARLREALTHAKADLSTAVAAAAKRIDGGKVIRAEAKADGTKLMFEVDVLADGKFQLVRVDQDGSIVDVSPSTVEPGGRSWTFDEAPAGQPPVGWSMHYTHPEAGKARWTIEHDEKPMTGPNVLQLETASGSRVFNLALIDGTSYADVDVRTRLRPNTGAVDQGGGVVWRCRDANNYYICRFNPLESNFRVYRVVDGQRRQLQSVDIAAEPGRWYAVRAKMIGDHIMCFLDGKKLLDVRDDTLKAPGMVGLWTKADASSSFDNVAVRNGVPTAADAAPVASPGDVPKTARTHEDDDDDD